MISVETGYLLSGCVMLVLAATFALAQWRRWHRSSPAGRAFGVALSFYFLRRGLALVDIADGSAGEIGAWASQPEVLLGSVTALLLSTVVLLLEPESARQERMRQPPVEGYEDE